MKSVATLSTKGQLAIPKDLREKLQLKQGSRVTLTIEGDELRIRKADDWIALEGMLAGSKRSATEVLLEERRLDRAREK